MENILDNAKIKVVKIKIPYKAFRVWEYKDAITFCDEAINNDFVDTVCINKSKNIMLKIEKKLGVVTTYFYNNKKLETIHTLKTDVIKDIYDNRKSINRRYFNVRTGDLIRCAPVMFEEDNKNE